MKDENEKIDNEIPEGEELDFSKPNFEFIPKGSHEWRQQGYYLLCRSCELEHAVWIGAQKLMIGISESGQPILKDRV